MVGEALLHTSRIADDADSKTGSEAAEADADAGCELKKTRVQRLLLLEAVGNNDGGDKAVDGEDLGHDGADGVLHEALRAEHARGEDGAGRLGRAVGRAEDGKDNGGRAADGAEEGLFPPPGGRRSCQPLEMSITLFAYHLRVR